MEITGIGVMDDVVRKVRAEINQIFSGIPAHWKRNLYDQVTVLVVSRGNVEIVRSHDMEGENFVIPVGDVTRESLEVVRVDVLTLYLGVLINFDESVKAIVDETMSSFSVLKKDQLTALVLWFMGEDVSLRISVAAQFACEEIDRHLAGRYVPRFSRDHWLSIQ